jgi:hypothetical protein
MGYVRPSETDLLHWAGMIEKAILAAGEGAQIVPLAVQAPKVKR